MTLADWVERSTVSTRDVREAFETALLEGSATAEMNGGIPMRCVNADVSPEIWEISFRFWLSMQMV